jgi:hypothetical protein
LLGRAKEHYRHVVIALDDLDKTDASPEGFVRLR